MEDFNFIYIYLFFHYFFNIDSDNIQPEWNAQADTEALQIKETKSIEFRLRLNDCRSFEHTTFCGNKFQTFMQRFLKIYLSRLQLNFPLYSVKPLLRVRTLRTWKKVSKGMSTNSYNILKYIDRSHLIRRISRDSALRILSLSGYGMPLRPRSLW